MSNMRHSGNSHTCIFNSKNSSIFRKTFSNKRSIQYFTEYLNNKYLYHLHPGFVAKIVGHNHKKYFIDYKPYQPSLINETDAEKYLDLITNIHRSSSNKSNSIKLLASQPLTDLQSFSKSFIKRIETFQGIKHEIHSPIADHLLKIKKYHLQLLSSVNGHHLHSKLVFSHADSGLHNCLTDGEGNIMLSDLEYAGLDSPIKQCLDYVLHPKTQSYERSFTRWIDYFTEDIISKRDLKDLNIYSALLALKWSLIMLNEYQPFIWDFRLLSDPSRAARKEEILKVQYSKSLMYYVASRRLADGHSPDKLFTASERNLLSDPY